MLDGLALGDDVTFLRHATHVHGTQHLGGRSHAPPNPGLGLGGMGLGLQSM